MKIFKWLACRFNNDQFGCILVAIISAVVALFLFAASNAHAVEYSVSVGNTYSLTTPDGDWWQSRYSHELPGKVPSFSLRADHRIGDLGIGAGYMYMGHFMSNATVVANDAAYTARVPYPLSHCQGNQVEQGLFITGRRYIGKFYLEAGPILKHSNFEMNVPDEHGSATAPMQYLRFTAKGWAVAGMLAAGYEVTDHWSASVAYLPTGNVGGTGGGIVGNYSPNMSIAYKF